MPNANSAYVITMEFNSAEEAGLALAWIGQPNAPVGLAHGNLTTPDGLVLPLWEKYHEAMDLVGPDED